MSLTVFGIGLKEEPEILFVDAMGYRVERDALGEVKVPADVYYGSETQRAIENFPISGMHMQKSFIHTYALIKKACAAANMKLGKLDGEKGKAIIKACDEVSSGKLDSQFQVDAFQAGAGTSTNMNLNEVIANRAIELLKGKRGDYKIVHPNDHVNMSQSTNDTFHTAIHVAALNEIKTKLLPALKSLEKTLLKKSREFDKIVKTGRTHLQDAVPMTLGQEFSGYAYSIEVAADRLETAIKEIRYIPLGGTAIGTGINTPKGYKEAAISELNKLTGERFEPSRVVFFEMQDQATEAFVSAALRNAAISLNKMANDLRLLSSGPRGGISEVILPEVQPGSSIMPGKINPSMCEMLSMVCFTAMGLDRTVSEAANSGQLELNVFMPIVASSLLFSIRILSKAVDAFDKKCVSGIEPNLANIKKHVADDLSVATALNPFIGYAKAAEVARKAYKEGKSVKEVCLELKILDKRKLDEILDPKKLV